MLPNRFGLSYETSEQLRRLKQNTGITPNLSSRLAFFRSIEKGFNYDINSPIVIDTKTALDKTTWLGDVTVYVELLLKEKYPNLDKKGLAKAWAAHVLDGASSFKGCRTVIDFINTLRN